MTKVREEALLQIEQSLFFILLCQLTNINIRDWVITIFSESDSCKSARRAIQIPSAV
jgi:hypothetical protein